MRLRVISRLGKILKFHENLKTSPKLLLSTGLEDNLDHKAYLKLLSWLRVGYSGPISTNPLIPSQRGKDRLLELHAPSAVCAPDTIINNDGFDLPATSAKEFLSKHRGCAHAIFWVGSLQGVSDKFVTPRNRSFKLSTADYSSLKEAL
jgi:hypothetical protein